MKRLTRYGWLEYQPGPWEERHPWLCALGVVLLAVVGVVIYVCVP